LTETLKFTNTTLHFLGQVMQVVVTCLTSE